MTPARLARIVLAVALRPVLWSTALTQAARLARGGWWRHWPPLPVPDPAYVRFRTETAQGGSEHVPEVADVLSYLYWCRNFNRLR